MILNITKDESDRAVKELRERMDEYGPFSPKSKIIMGAIKGITNLENAENLVNHEIDMLERKLGVPNDMVYSTVAYEDELILYLIPNIYFFKGTDTATIIINRDYYDTAFMHPWWQNGGMSLWNNYFFHEVGFDKGEIEVPENIAEKFISEAIKIDDWQDDMFYIF
ncbi:MAG: hypothetical protein WC783_03955 [Candidatus Paceibacterota bacterium]|jgi:hypothetical protein